MHGKISKIISEIVSESPEQITSVAIAEYPHPGAKTGKYWIGLDVSGKSLSFYGPIRCGRIARVAISENNKKSTMSASKEKAKKNYAVLRSFDPESLSPIITSDWDLSNVAQAIREIS